MITFPNLWVMNKSYLLFAFTVVSISCGRVDYQVFHFDTSSNGSPADTDTNTDTSNPIDSDTQTDTITDTQTDVDTELLTDNIWSSIGSTSWSTDSNWSLGRAPVAQDRVIFDGTISNVDCILDRDAVIGELLSQNIFAGVWNLQDHTLTVNGSFNVSAIGQFESGSSTVILTGEGDALEGYPFDIATEFYNLTVNGTYSISQWYIEVLGHLKVSGILTLSDSNVVVLYQNSSSDFSGGTVTGGGFLIIHQPEALSSEGTISCMVVFRQNGGDIPARIWDGHVRFESPSDDSNQTYVFEPGTHTFNNGILFELNDASNMTIDAATHSPVVNISDELDSRTDETGDISVLMGNSTWTTTDARVNLSGISTLSGILDVNISAGQAKWFTPPMEFMDVDMRKLGSGEMLLADDASALNCKSYQHMAGGIDFGGVGITATNNIYINGNANTIEGMQGVIFTSGGTIQFVGQEGNLLNLNPDATWYINAASGFTADHATVRNSDASGGAGGSATNCIDEGGNTNWTF